MSKTKAGPISVDRVSHFADRINNLLNEKEMLVDDVREVYDEAKKEGVNSTALRKVIAKRRAKAPDPAIAAAMEAYEHALDQAALMVSNGSTSLRKAAAESGFSKSAIHRRASHRNENASGGTVSETTDGNPSGESSRHDRRPDGPGSALATNSDVAPNEDARAALSLPLPDADGVSRAGTHSEPETGSATLVTTGNLDALSPGSFHPGPDSCSTDAARLRAVSKEPASEVAGNAGGDHDAGLKTPSLEVARVAPPTAASDADRLRAQIPASTDPAWLEREANRCLSGRVSRSDEQEAQGARREDDGKAVPCAGGQLGPVDRDLHDEGRLFVLPDNDVRILSSSGRESGADDALGRSTSTDGAKESGGAPGHEEPASLTVALGAIGSDSDRVAAPVLTPDVTTESDPWESAMAAKAKLDALKAARGIA